MTEIEKIIFASFTEPEGVVLPYNSRLYLNLLIYLCNAKAGGNFLQVSILLVPISRNSLYRILYCNHWEPIDWKGRVVLIILVSELLLLCLHSGLYTVLASRCRITQYVYTYTQQQLLTFVLY
ncbi:unnamed protein product [Albugo candida]|uniref:Uncharacterized protein n=1 Tax=Albugo candida TaxID=65357 RepID=A0A024GLT5_9STRA|nr:unnamed protein product [Albugo candida]|eukprot:CCI47455.1 unnamed protein product [Albugo candida]